MQTPTLETSIRTHDGRGAFFAVELFMTREFCSFRTMENDDLMKNTYLGITNSLFSSLLGRCELYSLNEN